MSYARGTKVAVNRSRDEIERTLKRYGADAIASGFDQQGAMVSFKYEGRVFRFQIPYPDPEDFRHTPTGLLRTVAQTETFWEQGVRERWRALLLITKAKLEAVTAGITSFEEEFLAYTVLPDGSTLGQFMLPQLHRALEAGEMPPMLPAPE